MNLDHITVLVTGASRGAGAAIAKSCADYGAKVVVHYNGNKQAADAVCAEIGANAMALVADVADEAAVRQMLAATVDRFGGLDILVVNAGVDLDKRTVEVSHSSDWTATLQVNLFGAYYCAKQAIPHLKRRGGGKIILIGSGIGHRAGAARSAYACSKAGVWMLTRVLAQELRPDNISVNELVPGPVRTAMTAGTPARDIVPEGESEWLKQPEDVVPLALFLAGQPDIGPTAQSFSLMRRDGS